MTTAVSATQSLPPDKITVKQGRVVRYEQWTSWNGTPWCTIQIERTETGFRSDIGDPEHGGYQLSGSVEYVTCRLNSVISWALRQLFTMDDPTKERVQAMYPNHVIEEI